MMDRREFLERCGAAGLGQTLFPGALLGLMAQSASAQQAAKYEAPRISENPAITLEMLAAAAAIAGITLTDEQKKMMLGDVITQLKGLQAIRDLHLPNSVAPADVFDPRPVGFVMPKAAAAVEQVHEKADAALLADKEKLAFASIGELGALLRAKKISAVELVKFYLERLRRLDPKLHLLITATDARALKQAAALDAEAAKGKWRGPLHGIPWGAKDLLAVKGYPTTWGAGGFEHQVIDEDATVVQRLDAAGAVLIAKLTLGALAQGDLWFGGKTRNPWNPKQGSSGSSAGPASAVAAGCCAFAIGSETQGSISSPSTRCGTTGHRPTFGFVPRTGAMALSWSMDKLGPICHNAQDAALVMAAIAGADEKDLSVRSDVRFMQAGRTELGSLRIGYLESAFAEPTPRAAEKDETAAQREQRERNFERQRYDSKYDRAALDVLRGMGIKLIPVKLPALPFSSISKVLGVEAAAAFDEITRNGRVNLLTEQSPNDWPNQFRTARMYSGVDYVQAMRARSLIIAELAKLFASVDIIVTPSGGPQLTATNLSGHPAVIVPNGLRDQDAPLPQDTTDGGRMNVGGPGTPVSVTFLGQLYDDARLLAFARMYQEKTRFHLAHPAL
ncbi:amidase [Terriglobus sp. TAA 43]|uniref:amidase n=1 Tax=Terriglobus sp. TAA 43 TaxID=278961 RepID=UPI0006486B37|nr:amidase [Terriglobus sp. TAA 43]